MSLVGHEPRKDLNLNMVIETREFGFIEIDEKDIIHFPYGIYGFEDIKDYMDVIYRQRRPGYVDAGCK